MANKQKSRPFRPFTALLLLIAAGLLLVLLNHTAAYDWLRLYNYTPPAAVATLAHQDTMTDYAKHMLYVNHPQQEVRGSFSQYCPAGTEQTVVLGCYKPTQRGIYLLSVDQPELAGIEQVTAAHEMLHAAYDRLSGSDRKNVDAMLLSYYRTGLSDQTIKQTIEAYKKTEPNALPNEMHSIFGTEIAQLPAGLQTYYTKYFSNRSAVTGYYQSYEAAFTSRQQQIKSYDSQLNQLKPQIGELQTTAKQQQAQLDSQRTQLDTYRSQHNDQAYNSGVNSYNQAVAAYNSNVRQLQSLITDYNAAVARRNSIALEERQLVQSISSPATTR